MTRIVVFPVNANVISKLCVNIFWKFDKIDIIVDLMGFGCIWLILRLFFNVMRECNVDAYEINYPGLFYIIWREDIHLEVYLSIRVLLRRSFNKHDF